MGIVPGGELFDVIHQQGDDGEWSSGLPEDDSKFYAMMITDTLEYIHRREYVYRDLKPENVLIDQDGTYARKVIPFLTVGARPDEFADNSLIFVRRVPYSL